MINRLAERDSQTGCGAVVWADGPADVLGRPVNEAVVCLSVFEANIIKTCVHVFYIVLHY